MLYAFHASRGNWQSAAAAMLALSRRLVGEGVGGAGALTEAELALGAAVSALRWVLALWGRWAMDFPLHPCACIATTSYGSISAELLAGLDMHVEKPSCEAVFPWTSS